MIHVRLYPSKDEDIAEKARWLNEHWIEWSKDYNSLSAMDDMGVSYMKKPDIIAVFKNEEDLTMFIMRFGKKLLSALRIDPANHEFNGELE